MEMEEHARVIDFMPDGRSADREREPTAQLVGEKYFTLLEVAIKRQTPCALGQRLYIGKDERQEVEKIKKRIEFNDLTATARNELPLVVRNIIHDREADFVNMFNKAGPISIRLHQLELLPGIGKKHLQEILEAREPLGVVQRGLLLEPELPDRPLPFFKDFHHFCQGRRADFVCAFAYHVNHQHFA